MEKKNCPRKVAPSPLENWFEDKNAPEKNASQKTPEKINALGNTQIWKISIILV